MPYINSIQEMALKEGKQEGIEEGLARGIEKGLAKGIEEGKSAGLAEGLHTSILRILEKKFNCKNGSTGLAIRAERNIGRLEALLDNALEVKTLAEFKRKLAR